MKPTYENAKILDEAIYQMTNWNYIKLIHAYLKKVEKDFSETDDYLNNFTEEQFCNKLKEHYDIKGKVDYNKIARAKLKDDDAIPLEKDEQKQFIKYLREQNKLRPKDKKWWISSSANGQMRSAADNASYMASLKAMGLSIGEPDIKILVGNGLSIWVEMKRIKGSTISKEQKERIEWLNANGYPARICYGCKDAIVFFEEAIKINT